MASIGKNIAQLRRHRGLTQEQLAAQLHVTRQTVSSWETGRTQPDLELLHSIAGALDTELLSLLYGARPRRRGPMAAAAALVLTTALLLLFLHTVGAEALRQYYYRFQTSAAFYLALAATPLSGMTGGAAVLSLIHLRWPLTLPRRTRRIVLIVGLVYLALVLLCIPVVFGNWLSSAALRRIAVTFALVALHQPLCYAPVGAALFLAVPK